MSEELALSILLQNIKEKNDLKKDENKWILHSIYTGIAAKRIAKSLNLSDDYASSIGYLHDIGRIINHNNHPIEGYLYLDNLGYPDIGRYSITHSFINNDINSTAGGGPKDKESYNFINNYLNSIELNIYDNIIQLCDLFCLDKGFTTIEKRMIDISKRKGVYDNSYDHFKSVINLKKYIEKKINKNLYDLFPEIEKEDLDNIENDHESLIKMINEKSLIKNLKKK